MKTFKETTAILDITKSQLTELVDNHHFPKAIPPKVGYNPTWQFSQKYLENYLKWINRCVTRLNNEYVSLADAMRIIGNRIEIPFSTTIEAILNREIPITAKDLHCINLKSVLIPTNQLHLWIKEKIRVPDYITIPELANVLKINQEFTYQLVNNGLIKYKTIRNTRMIGKYHLADFQNNYTLLADFSKRVKTNSRTLMKQLNEQGIYPVDYLWESKLRQKVYEAHKLERLELIYTKSV